MQYLKSYQGEFHAHMPEVLGRALSSIFGVQRGNQLKTIQRTQSLE